MTYIPAPSFILFCQLASCALYVKISAVAGVLEAENLEWEKSKKFALIVFGFIGTLFANVTSLRVSLCCAPFVARHSSAPCVSHFLAALRCAKASHVWPVPRRGSHCVQRMAST